MPTFVIDASVLSASGESGDNVVPVRCRETLDSVLKICFQAAVSQEILKEWNDHQSNYARKWRVAMASRGKLRPTQPVRRNEVRTAVTLHAVDANHKANIMKDVHLIEAALDTDKVVLSLDDTARENFGAIANGYDEGGQLKAIAWVNPAAHLPDAKAWLSQGASLNEAWFLGFSNTQ